MINRIKNILSQVEGIDAWQITNKHTTSNELFYVKQNIDMNRIKEVNDYSVTVYNIFQEDDEKYTGSSKVLIAPSMTDPEIKEAIEEAAFASTFVKNQYYPLNNKSLSGHIESSSNLKDKAFESWLPEFSTALFKHDDPTTNPLNSAELFLNKHVNTLVNSEGVDVSYTKYDGHIEFITNWVGQEEVESYKDIKFSGFDPSIIENEVKDMIEMTKEKTTAEPTPSLSEANVILTGGPVKEFFSYYTTRANAEMVYSQISQFKVGENVQGDDITGDKVNITLTPTLENSTQSAPVDADGVELKTLELIKDGQLLSYWGSHRYTYYLDTPTTGNIGNRVIASGKHSVADFKKEPYIELLEFSDFQMDPLTGNFAGEIRLARYFDGSTTKPVTTGSVSGNIKNVQNNMLLSTERYQDNNYQGPKHIRLTKVNIAGN